MFASRNLLCAPLFVATFVGAAACNDSATVAAPSAIVTDTLPSASVRWNQRAVALVVSRQPTGNGQAAVSRILTYLSVAQYRAVTSVLAAPHEHTIPSMAAAVGGASVAVLSSFFPLDGAAIEAQFKADVATTPNPNNDDVAAGESLGRGIGAAIVARATADNYLVTAAPATPVGPDKWVSSSAAVVRSLYGTRPFFLTSPSQLRSPAPPVMGSAAFNTALAEVRQIADTRTPAQLATAIAWNTSSGTFTAGALNLIADSVLLTNRFNEAESARVLAFANAAAFDAQIACWDAKFAYWYPRPTTADTKITMAIALPNHPSYPSGHSCMTGAFMGVLSNGFPLHRAKFDGMVDEAGMSRIYGGIHYRFDIDAGRDIGRAAAALALSGSLQ